MYISYGRGQTPSDKPTDELFYVNNCGIFRNMTYRTNINRPSGRDDYQIIYVTGGFIEVKTKSGWKRAEKGSLIIFEPKVMQTYFSYGDNNTSYCWIHFTGTLSRKIMSELNLKSGIYSVGEFDNFVIRCTEIIAAMKKQNDILNVKISALALAILGEIPEKLTTLKSSKFSDIVFMMENDYPNGRKIEEYAKIYNLSSTHFSRLFKAEYGLTPTNYRLKLLVDKSKPLLTDSTLKISEIALSCGFEDAFYFSRIFKKFTGMSPENYRKTYK